MKFNQNIFKVQVFLAHDAKSLFVGTLTLEKRKIFFAYSREFLATGIPLSPFKLPLKEGTFSAQEPCFDGLFGVFNDSLPDGWGRLLLDRKLSQLGLNPQGLSPLDRLCFVGENGMGALSYKPEIGEYSQAQQDDLDEIAGQVSLFEQSNEGEFLDSLLALNGSSAGARPKVILRRESEEWLIKFRSSFDPVDVGAIEYAYHLMAREALLDVPQARLFPSKKCSGYFGVVRFDREKGKKIHMHSLSGLLHADHRIPSLDYEAILQATRLLTNQEKECEKQFRAAVFNILTHNRDDHAKNFSFLLKEQWQVSPAYDLTFSSGPGGEHCTTVMGEGRNFSKDLLLKLAKNAGIEQKKAQEIIDQVRLATSHWERHAQEAGVTTTSRQSIQKVLTGLI